MDICTDYALFPITNSLARFSLRNYKQLRKLIRFSLTDMTYGTITGTSCALLQRQENTSKSGEWIVDSG